MNRRYEQPGFSLMEVLFAVVVLTMGMVFVASQFPLGIINARKVSDAVLTNINSHNAAVMTEVQLKAALTNPGYAFPTDYPALALEHRNHRVHLLNTPNFLVDSSPATVALYDPEMYGRHVVTAIYRSSLFKNLPKEQKVPRWPFWSQNALDVDGYADFTEKYIGDIGFMTCPPLTVSDSEVQALLPDDFNIDYPAADAAQQQDMMLKMVQPALFEAALKRSTVWGALYRCLNPGSFRYANKYAFYIFTLRNNINGARYAVQDPDAFNNGVPEPSQDAATDRLFPVPWLVAPENPVVDPGVSSTRIPGYRDRFYLDGNDPFINLLRKGTILVNYDTGNIYAVKEIQADATYDQEVYDYVVIVEPEIVGLAQLFWVYPPPVIRQSNGNFDGFADPQPVISVTAPPVEIIF